MVISSSLYFSLKVWLYFLLSLLHCIFNIVLSVLALILIMIFIRRGKIVAVFFDLTNRIYISFVALSIINR